MADMRTLWRLCREKAASTASEAFSGAGPAAEPKRWNDEGRRVVYCAISPALALIELLVDMSCGEEWPSLVLFRAEACPRTWRASE